MRYTVTELTFLMLNNSLNVYEQTRLSSNFVTSQSTKGYRHLKKLIWQDIKKQLEDF